jgi:hypothetical protein
MPKTLRNEISTEWSSSLAYAIGLITSDGCLSKEAPRINFGSKDMEMMINFKKALGLRNKIGRHARGGETEKKYFYLNFKSKNLYHFLLAIGLTPAKSQTIKSVNVPDELFGDFLRGLFDGDGTFYTFWDKRWPNSFVFKTAFASASPSFVNWLDYRISDLYGIKGYKHKGSGVLNLEYTKGASEKLFQKMYYGKDILFLGRKYNKMKNALEYDMELRLGKTRRTSSSARALP